MARMEEVELTNMCMVCDGKGNVLVQNKKCDRTWHGWNFPGGHVEQGEFVTPSVVVRSGRKRALRSKTRSSAGSRSSRKSRTGNGLSSFCM